MGHASTNDQINTSPWSACVSAVVSVRAGINFSHTVYTPLDIDLALLCPYLAESRQEALRYGMEHVLEQELAGVFRDELGFTEEQMLELAQGLHPPASPLIREPQE